MDETPLLIAVLVLCVGCSTDAPTDRSQAERGDAASRVDTGSPVDAAPADGSSGEDASPVEPEDIGPQSDGDATYYPTPRIWRLAEEASSWSVFGRGMDHSLDAPSSPIRAAFDIEHSNFAFVLTETALHKLLLDSDRHGDPNPSWVESTPLDEIDAELASATILAAHANPEKSPDDEVVVVGLKDGTPRRWRATYSLDDKTFSNFEGESIEWTHDAAPTPVEIGLAWRDNVNARGWFSGEPPCGISPTGEFRAYVGYLTGEKLHLHDVWYCKDYFRARPIQESGPAVDGFPAVDKLAAAFWHDRELFLVGR